MSREARARSTKESDVMNHPYVPTCPRPSSGTFRSRTLAALLLMAPAVLLLHAPVAQSQGTLSIADAAADEGNAITFTVTLEPAQSAVVTVDYATSVEAGDTARESAPPDYPARDYRQKTGTLTFAANETSKTFTVTTQGRGFPRGRRNLHGHAEQSERAGRHQHHDGARRRGRSATSIPDVSSFSRRVQQQRPRKAPASPSPLPWTWVRSRV